MLKQETVDLKIGTIKKNNYGTDMKVIDVISYDRVIIQFQDEYKIEKEIFWENFKRGTVANPYDRTIFGIGYLGVGKYETKHDGNKVNKAYSNWNDMFVRCYSEEKKDKFPAYYGICSVCDEWHNYQNFAKWYEENFYPVEGTRVHIDKDILVKGNKVYSPETCCYVPQRINMVFMKKSRITDSDLPTGIRRTLTGYSAEYNTKYLGNYENLEDAILQYDKAKRTHIRDLAEEYKSILPIKTYDALLKW
jgi:hypothetical protein